MEDGRRWRTGGGGGAGRTVVRMPLSASAEKMRKGLRENRNITEGNENGEGRERERDENGVGQNGVRTGTGENQNGTRTGAGENENRRRTGTTRTGAEQNG